MPAFITHSLFGSDVCMALPQGGLRQFLLRNSTAYEWGLQGPDLLFFNGVLSPAKKHDINRFGGLMHTTHTDELLNELQGYLLSHKNSACFETIAAYAYGFCCHYSLDSVTHPYIYCLQERIKQTLPAASHGGVHHKLESDIDTDLYYYKTGKPVRSFRLSSQLLADKNGQYAIAELLRHLLEVVYGCAVPTAELAGCFREAYHAVCLLVGSPLALPLASSLDFLVGKRNALSAHVRRTTAKGDVLNLKRTPWRHLTDDSAPVSMTYPELEAQARIKALTILSSIWNGLEQNRPICFSGLLSFDNGAPPQGETGEGDISYRK